MNAVTLNMNMSLSNTGFTGRNMLFRFLWLRSRNTWIPIQHVGRAVPLPIHTSHSHRRLRSSTAGPSSSHFLFTLPIRVWCCSCRVFVCVTCFSFHTSGWEAQQLGRAVPWPQRRPPGECARPRAWRRTHRRHDVSGMLLFLLYIYIYLYICGVGPIDGTTYQACYYSYYIYI